jgi:hypothetical protein
MALTLFYIAPFAWNQWKSASSACADWRGKNDLTLLNPLRQRGPEQVAAIFLASLQTGKCLDLPLQMFQNATTRAAACSIGSHYQLKSWTLRGRTVSNNEIGLGYSVAWGGMSEQSDPIWIWSVRQGRDWQITNADTYY